MGITNKKGVGFYFAALAGAVAIAACIFYMTWAPAHEAMNVMILASLIVGLVLDVILIFYDNDYIVIAATAIYSIALFQLLGDSVGSFVDAYQGIVMFGDPTQVGTILLISGLIAISILASITAGFTKRIKDS